MRAQCAPPHPLFSAPATCLPPGSPTWRWLPGTLLCNCASQLATQICAPPHSLPARLSCILNPLYPHSASSHCPLPPPLPPPGLSATEEVPGSIEARLSPQLAQAAEFTPQELEHIDGERGTGRGAPLSRPG